MAAITEDEKLDRVGSIPRKMVTLSKTTISLKMKQLIRGKEKKNGRKSCKHKNR